MPAAVEQLEISEVLKQHDRLVIATEYTVIGKIATLTTDAGRIDFGKVGPVIGQALHTGELLLLDMWTPLPALRISSDEFCPKCLAKCDECDGHGKRICNFTGCGGLGKIVIGNDECKCAGRKKNCTKCRGLGTIPTYRECECCAGKGKMTCGSCRGTGKRPTGTVAGSLARNAPTCKACDGYKRKGKVERQSWAPHAQGLVDVAGKQFVAIAPIGSMVLHAIGNESGNQMKRVTFLPDSEGRLASLLVENPDAMSKAYLVGGIPVRK